MFSCLFKKKVAATPPKTQDVKKADPNTLSLFHSRDVIRNVFSEYLTTKEHEAMNGLEIFQSLAGDLLEPKTQTDELLHSIKRANWQQMEKLLSQNPDRWKLMFNETHHTLTDGTEEVISPLKYAVKILDTYSRNILLKFVPEKMQPLFWQHVREQKNHINLESLVQTFKHYQELCTTVDNPEQLKYWNTQYGFEMRKLAYDAQHFLKEMCQRDRAWNKHAQFDYPVVWDTAIIERHHKVYSDSSYHYVSIDEIASQLGVSFSLARGTSCGAYSAMALGNAQGPAPFVRRLENGRIDVETLCRLLEVRKNDLELDLAKQASIECTRIEAPEDSSHVVPQDAHLSQQSSEPAHGEYKVVFHGTW